MSLISVVIPAKNEEKNIRFTVENIDREFTQQGFDYEIIVVNDGSTDGTEQIVKEIKEKNDKVLLIRNKPPFGFGYAIRKGLDHFRGDYVIISMADSSDDPKDMVKFIKEVQNGYDCCFGSRWLKEAEVTGYPKIKLMLNRIVNWGINVLFQLNYADATNAFKCYSRETIMGIKPILSRHFNITVELPLKAIVRGYRYTVVPTHWRERRKGKTKLKLQEMGSRYLFIIMYILLEKLLCGSDYKKRKNS